MIFDAERDFKNCLDTAKKEGKAEGIAEGIIKGRAEGIAETARNLKQIGLDISQISKGTGLSIDEINKL